MRTPEVGSWAGRARYTPIGLSFSDAAAHAVQFVWSGESISLHAWASHEIPKENDVSGELEALNVICAQGAFVGRQVVTAVPLRDVSVRKLYLPPGTDLGNPRELAAILMREAGSVLPFSPERAVVDYLPLDPEMVEGQERHPVLLVASLKEHVHRLLSIVKAAGLHCGELDIAPCAAVRIAANGQGNLAVVHFDSEATGVAIAKERQLCFFRSIALGAGRLLDLLQRSLSVSEEEARIMLRECGMVRGGAGRLDLSRVAETGEVASAVVSDAVFEACRPALEELVFELKRSFNHFSQLRGGFAVANVALLGNGAPLHMEAYLAEELSMPVQRGLTIRKLGVLSELGPEGADAFALAAGLALREEEA